MTGFFDAKRPFYFGLLEGVNTLQVPGATLVVRGTATWVLQTNAQTIGVWCTDRIDELIKYVYGTQSDAQTVGCLKAKLHIKIDR